MREFYEFFSGGGMARIGLGADWRCAFANDFDAKKGAIYRTNFGAGHLMVADVAKLTTDDVPGRADLVWASPPCQDISLAGNGAGLDGARYGAHSGLCLEPQRFPDSPNRRHFSPCRLAPGETYRHVSEFRFA